MNPYALSDTAPSRRRVYLFHHLGSTNYLTDSLERVATRCDYGEGNRGIAATGYGGSKSASLAPSIAVAVISNVWTLPV